MMWYQRICFIAFMVFGSVSWLAVEGCQTNPSLVKPSAKTKSQITTRGPVKPSYTTVKVFYGTDRKPTGNNDYFGGERGNPGKLQLGFVEVSIPLNHETAEVESPAFWKFELRNDPEKHVVILNRTTLSDDQFYDALKAKVSQSRNKDAFVFIHGFNTTFAYAARRTAQIAHDLDFQGAPILYSWPSHGGLWGWWHYLSDTDAVRLTGPHLQNFLEHIQHRSGANTIFLIAHSMGNRALTEALKEIGEDLHPHRTPPPFKQVVLNAPDIDADVFQSLAESITKASERVTLYASSNDKALALTKVLYGGFPRVGDTSDSIAAIPGVEIIDVSQFETEDLFGHSYYDALINDLRRLFRGVFSPKERHLSPASFNGTHYWKLTSNPVE